MRYGVRPANGNAAASRPRSSPRMAIAGFPDDDVNAATSPSPFLSGDPASDAADVPDDFSASAPTNTAGCADPFRGIGRFIADVSNPNRAATSAAAASST